MNVTFLFGCKILAECLCERACVYVSVCMCLCVCISLLCGCVSLLCVCVGVCGYINHSELKLVSRLYERVMFVGSTTQILHDFTLISSEHAECIILLVLSPASYDK